MVSWHRHSIESLDGVDMDSADRSLKRAAMADIAAVEILLRLWDPIGVKPGIFAPVDEYNSYAPHIVSMVKGGCTFEELVAHLEHLRVLGQRRRRAKAAAATSRRRSLKLSCPLTIGWRGRKRRTHVHNRIGNHQLTIGLSVIGRNR